MGRLAFLILALILTSIAVVRAQAAPEARTPPTAWRLWGGFGAGAGGERGGVMGELVFQKSPHQLTARAIGMIDLYGAEGGNQPVGEIGLLYGRTETGPRGHASFSAGLAVTDMNLDTQGLTIGVPVVAEVAFRISPFMGIGGQVFTNINALGSYGGVALFIQLGWLAH